MRARFKIVRLHVYTINNPLKSKPMISNENHFYFLKARIAIMISFLFKRFTFMENVSVIVRKIICLLYTFARTLIQQYCYSVRGYARLFLYQTHSHIDGHIIGNVGFSVLAQWLVNMWSGEFRDQTTNFTTDRQLFLLRDGHLMA